MTPKSTSSTMTFPHNVRIEYLLPRYFRMNVGPAWVWGPVRMHLERFMLGLMFYSHHPEILHHFIIEHVFCNWSAMGQWRIFMSKGDMCNMHVRSSLLPQSYMAFAMPTSTEFLWFHNAWKFSETQSENKCLIWRHWQPLEGTLSFRIRTCFKCRKKTTAF